MPEISPLPQRRGLDAAWVRTLDGNVEANWSTMRDFLFERLGPGRVHVDEMLAAGEFVDADGQPITATQPYQPNFFIFFHRRLRPEPEVPEAIEVLFADERIVVIDKPHYLSSIPRGRHVVESVIVKARQLLDEPELTVAHRLDRATAGVLLLTRTKRWRGAYQQLFAHHQVQKEYLAVAGFRAELAFPRRVSSHIEKRPGNWRVEVTAEEPNAVTDIELLRIVDDRALYRAKPLTGKTHQIRSHFNQLKIPIVGDQLYPEILDVDIDDFSNPLQLLAHRLSFVDPIDGSQREFTSKRRLQITP